MTKRIVLGDIGGTNVRFAVLTDGALGAIAHMAVADYESFGDALAAFLARQPEPIRSAVFGVAGVVEGKRCALTNSPWVVDAAELSARFGLSDVRIVNDFEAIAWSLPKLARQDLRTLGGREPKPEAPMLVLGPGTGLGVAAYVPRGSLVLHSEGGHSTLPGGSPREDTVIAALRRQFGHVSAERVLSGPGLESLYRAVAALDEVGVPARSAAEIAQAALAGECPVSRTALDLFCALLGEVAGNFALSFCAEGGVFIAGGIAPHIADYLPRSQFRARFEAKGRMSPYVAPIPAYLILRRDPAFLGLQALAAQRKLA
jgi:glucokinase